MRFYVRYSTYPYEGETDAVLDTIEGVLELLNQHAPNPNFRFQVIEGRLVEFEPAETVKTYRKKAS